MSGKIQQVERYWNARPCNVRHSSLPVNSLRYSQEVTARKYKVEPHIVSFSEFFKCWQGCRVLDVGCGIGTMALDFARQGASVTAIDLSSKSIAVAKQRATTEQLSHCITFKQVNIETDPSTWQLPFSSYDVIYSFGVIHHTPHPERAIKNLAKLAHPSTTFKLMMYYRYSWKVFRILMQHGIRLYNVDRVVAKSSEAQSGCPVTYTYTKRSIRRLLQSCGWEVNSTQVDHIFPYHVPSYIKRIYRREWYWRVIPTRLFRWLESKIGWHLLVKASLKCELQ